MTSEILTTPEHPFGGMHIYFSGAIDGVNEADHEFPEQLVAYMRENGATILDPQVAISSKEKPQEFFQTMLEVHGLTSEEWDALTQQEKDLRIYEKDISGATNASHVVALMNGASFGVGMELQRVLDKQEFGLDPTPILGLVHEDNYNQLSRMVRGASRKYPNFHLETYTSLADAEQAIFNFLCPKPVNNTRR